MPHLERTATPAPGSIRQNTAYTLASQVTTAAFTAALTLFLVRALGPEDYGVFALSLGIVTLLLVPTDFGLSSSAARYAAEHRQSPGAVGEVIRDALALKLLTAVPLCLGLLLAAGPIADAYGVESLEWPIRAMAFALLGQSVMMLFTGTFIALGRSRMNLMAVAGEAALELTLSVSLVLLGTEALGASLGRAIAYAGGAGLAMVLMVRLLGRGSVRVGRSAGRRRELARYAGVLLIVDAAFTLFLQVDVLLIGLFLTASAVGQFQAPARLVTLLHYPGLALAGGVTPRLARDPSAAPAVAAFERALKLVTVTQVALVTPIVVWSEPLMRLLLGPEYSESGDVLRALGPYIVLSGIAPLASLAVSYLGEARRRIPIALATVAVNIVLDVILIPEMGIVGAAIATNVAYLVYVPGHLWICRKLLGIRLVPLLVTTLRALLAGAAMAGVLVVAGTSTVALTAAVPAAVGGAAVFTLVLLVTGEISRADLLRTASAARAFVRLRTGR